MLALAALSRDADLFVSVSEEEAKSACERLAGQGFATTPSGAAGVAALLAGRPQDLRLDARSRALAFLTEGAETP